MSDREKNLLFLLLGALFIIGNIFAFSQLYQPRIQAAENRKKLAERKLTRGELVLAQQGEYDKTITWLERAEGKPSSYQTIEAKLQTDVKRSADRRRLTTKKEDPQPHTEGEYYHRVKVQFKVNGPEQQIQQWLLEIHRPNQLQVITKFDLQPQKNDLERADCEVEVEKWFLPTLDGQL